MEISSVDVMVRRGRMSVLDVYAITERNERIPIRLGSRLSIYGRVVAVDLLLQSDGNADATVGVSSNNGQPRMSLERY
jgi:hypothetical protein